jgi:hypothetical protein
MSTNLRDIFLSLCPIVAELCITILGAIALSRGMDGAIFASCIGALAGLGGYHIKTASASKLRGGVESPTHPNN